MCNVVSEDELDAAFAVSGGRRAAAKKNNSRGNAAKVLAKARGRCKVAVETVFDIIPTVPPASIMVGAAGAARPQDALQSHKKGGLKFSYVGILRGALGDESLDVYAFDTKLVAASALMSERSVKSHQTIVLDGVLDLQKNWKQKCSRLR